MIKCKNIIYNDEIFINIILFLFKKYFIKNLFKINYKLIT